jgi:cold shock CspA family protein/ribosome-associated translation inhibitor RaiA
MVRAVDIIFRDMPRSAAIEARVRKDVAKLEEFYDQILACHVVIESPHSHLHQGNLFHVGIDLTVPDGEIIVNRDPHEHHAHEDAYVAIRDAFRAATLKLQDFANRKRGEIKTRLVPPHGIIFELELEQGYGRIRSSDGRELYFHRNSFLGGEFDDLEVGDEVRFVEQVGRKGLQASTVQLISKHHLFG